MKLGLIGMNIQKSRAPALHRLLGELHGIELDYQLHEVAENTPEAFQRTLQALQSEGYTGCNVTFPFKQTAISHVQGPDLAVEQVGSTNTLALSTRIQATNTDFSGFVRGFKHCMGERPAQSALMIGAGGVGRAVGFGLAQVGLECLHIYDLDAAGAEKLVAALNARGIDARAIEAAEIPQVAAQVQGVINCTPVGHYTLPGCPIDPALINAQQWCFDAVYTPLNTEFVKACQARGMTVISGFELFLYQGLDAFEFWTGVKVDEGRARDAFLEAFDLTEA